MAKKATVTLTISATADPKLGAALAEAERQIEALQRNAQQTAAQGVGAEGFSQIFTVLKTAYKPVKASADYQSLVDAIAQRSGIDVAREAELNKEVAVVSRRTGNSRSQVAQLITQLMNRGMTLQQAQDNLNTAATYATGQGVGAGETATLMRALQQAGLNEPQAMREGLAVLAAQAKGGGYDSEELAKSIPKLLPVMKGKATGVEAVRELGALLQAQSGSANDADDAVEKVRHYLEADATTSGSFTGDEAMLKQQRAADGANGAVLKADLDHRQALSGTKWQQSQNALDDLLVSVGDGMRPLSDAVADKVPSVLQGLTEFTDAYPRAVAGLTAVAGLATFAYGAHNLYQVGKGVKGLVGKTERAGALAGSQPVRVHVTNFSELEMTLVSSGNSKKRSKGRQSRNRQPRRNGYTQPLKSSVRKIGGGSGGLGFAPARSLTAAPAAPIGGAGRGLLKRLPGAKVLDGVMQLAQVYSSDGTPQEKAQGYGAALGGMGGAMAGAAAGAAIGSVVPVVGTLIGGLVGSFVGGMRGEEAGGWLGKVVGAGLGIGEGGSKPAEVQPAPQAAVASTPGNQQFTFNASMPVTFNNSLADPSVAQQLEQMMRRTLTDLMARAESAQLTDPVYV